MPSDEPFRCYRKLQANVEWDTMDVDRVRLASQVVEPHVVALYAELAKHPASNNVIRGGVAQFEHRKGSSWGRLRGLFQDEDDIEYVSRRHRM